MQKWKNEKKNERNKITIRCGGNGGGNASKIFLISLFISSTSVGD